MGEVLQSGSYRYCAEENRRPAVSRTPHDVLYAPGVSWHLFPANARPALDLTTLSESRVHWDACARGVYRAPQASPKFCPSGRSAGSLENQDLRLIEIGMLQVDSCGILI